MLPSVPDVRAIITTAAADGVVQAFITDAEALTQACLASQPTALKATIVKWVAAHLLASVGLDSGEKAPDVTSRRLGDAAESFARPTPGEGLAATSYGKHAIALDPTGCLSRLGRRAAEFHTL